MKPDEKIGDPVAAFVRLSTATKAIVAVSKEELERREKAWKKERAKTKAS